MWVYPNPGLGGHMWPTRRFDLAHSPWWGSLTVLAHCMHPGGRLGNLNSGVPTGGEMLNFAGDFKHNPSPCLQSHLSLGDWLGGFAQELSLLKSLTFCLPSPPVGMPLKQSLAHRDVSVEEASPKITSEGSAPMRVHREHSGEASVPCLLLG